MKRFLSLTIVLLILTGSYRSLYAQFFPFQKKDPSVFVADYESLLAFKNINRIPYYYDKDEIEAINNAREANDIPQLYQLLFKYVSQFGIRNFYRDTKMLWELANLTEHYGSITQAKKLYQLVLKHSRLKDEVKEVKKYYDSTRVFDEPQYVPIEYYYDLIEARKEIDTLQPPVGIRLNMGFYINSQKSDYGPVLDTDNDILIFTSKRNPTVRILEEYTNEDLYFSKFQDGIWQEAKPLESINTIANEGSACITRDGQTLYFARCDAPDTYGNCDLFEATLKNDSTWGDIKNLGINVNSKAWDSHPTLSHTEDTLFFASDRIGGFGMSDIYFTYKTKKGWAVAQNAGPVINTRQNEVSPFYHPAFDIIYFSSNGHSLNFGEYDIYKSERAPHRWVEPKNLGPLVNGNGTEFYFTIDSRSEQLFYAKSIVNDMQNLDLYSFPLPMEGQPMAKTRLSGFLMDSANNSAYQNGVVSIIDLDEGIEVAPQFLRPDGSYEFYLINNRNYLMVIRGDEFFRIENIFYLDGDTTLYNHADPISSKIEFESIEFDNGKADLKPQMYGDLDKISNFLLDNPDFKLRISGHTDSDGNFDFNMKLSKARADAIAEYVTYFGGVPEARVETFGYGSTRPIVEEQSEEDKALNRRVEFEIYRPGKKALEEMKRKENEEFEDW